MSAARKLVARLAKHELAPGAMRRLSYPPYDVLVANVDGAFHAIEDACPHSGQSLARGVLVGTSVVCAGHDWGVCLRTGRVLVPEGCGANPVFDVVDEGELIAIVDGR